jgi:glycosyltransferase involved in cell wall biosynthesis
MDKLAVVSVVIPCRNEERFIGSCLDSIVSQDYPKDKIEILVIDGMSEDKTREIVFEYAGRYPCIKLLNNPKKHTSSAFNIGIKNASGEYITIIGAHSAHSSNKFRKSIEYMEKYKVDVVGARCDVINVDSSITSKAIACALSSLFGVGGFHREPIKKARFVDTAAGCFYKRKAFEIMGLYNEELLRAQDMELNKRLTKTGAKILIAPDIVYYYFPCGDLKSFYMHNFKDGLWITLSFKYSNTMPVSIRHLVPLGFVLSLMIFGATAIYSPIFLLLFVLIIFTYFLLNLCFSIRISIKRRDIRFIFLMPVVFAALHFSYGVGSLIGLARCFISGKFWKNLKIILSRY